jgi:hypothetical protein
VGLVLGLAGLAAFLTRSVHLHPGSWSVLSSVVAIAVVAIGVALVAKSRA